MPDGPLQGLRVVEIAQLAAGPFCGRLLADYGADVVKVEPRDGDRLRALSPAWFRGLNTNKFGVSLDDLSSEPGKRLFAALLDSADVLLHDLSADEARRWLGDPRHGRPALVVTSITPFGQSGPRAGWSGGDLVAAASGGLAFITGDPDREPLVPGGHQILHLAGVDAYAATLMAVFHARRTGVGQRVEVSLQEVAARVLESTVMPYQFNGTVRGRMGTHHPDVHGLGMQRLADGRWLFVGTLPQPRMWETAKELIGHPRWAEDERWEDAHARRDHADEVDALAAPVFGALSAEQIYPAMKAARVPVGLVRDVESLHDSDGQLASRGFFASVPGGDGTKYPGAPWRMSCTPWSLRREAPYVGEHNDLIYVDLLGYTPEELASWRRSGVI